MSATITVTGATLGGALTQLLMSDELVPGSDVSYQLCKTIYSYHPLGRKMADAPLYMAQSQKREISISNAPEDRVREAFEKQWQLLHADKYINQLGSISRIYGVGSLIVGADGLDPEKPLPVDKLADLKLFFNLLDPLNTAGSLVLNQDPNSPDFMKSATIAVSGKPYHRSRSLVLMNEHPVYIEYTTSAFGYVGRSVYQRALFPLKSFVNTMITDDMIARKAGLIIAKLKSPGSPLDRAMQVLSGVKRQILKEAQTNNVLSVDITESIESLNLQNIDGAGSFARTNILKNIATAADMPAKMLENETMVAGFGEGTEDAKSIARYIDGIRMWLQPAYDFFDEICMACAWNEEFYATIQADFPEYKDVSHKEAFWRWKNSFKASWPSLLKDPEADTKAEDVKQKAIISMLQVLMPNMDPDNRTRLIEWAVESSGENKTLFPRPLVLDYEALAEYEPPQPAEAPHEHMPEGL
jgi:hypothetical protein